MELPNLPVPALANTRKRYLSSLRPLLDDSQYASACAAADNFFESATIKGLQQALVARGAAEKNWIEEW